MSQDGADDEWVSQVNAELVGEVPKPVDLNTQEVFATWLFSGGKTPCPKYPEGIDRHNERLAAELRSATAAAEEAMSKLPKEAPPVTGPPICCGGPMRPAAIGGWICNGGRPAMDGKGCDAHQAENGTRSPSYWWREKTMERERRASLQPATVPPGVALSPADAAFGETCCSTTRTPPSQVCGWFDVGMTSRCVCCDHERLCHPRGCFPVAYDRDQSLTTPPASRPSSPSCGHKYWYWSCGPCHAYDWGSGPPARSEPSTSRSDSPQVGGPATSADFSEGVLASLTRLMSESTAANQRCAQLESEVARTTEVLAEVHAKLHADTPSMEGNTTPRSVVLAHQISHEVDWFLDEERRMEEWARELYAAIREWVEASDAPASSSIPLESSVWLARSVTAEHALRALADASPKEPQATGLLERAQQLEVDAQESRNLLASAVDTVDAVHSSSLVDCATRAAQLVRWAAELRAALADVLVQRRTSEGYASAEEQDVVREARRVLETGGRL